MVVEMCDRGTSLWWTGSTKVVRKQGLGVVFHGLSLGLIPPSRFCLLSLPQILRTTLPYWDQVLASQQLT